MELPFPRKEGDGNLSHAFFKGNGRLWGVELDHALRGQHKGGSNRRMSCHGQFDRRGKKAYSIVICRILSREYEGTLREIEFLGQCLHGLRGQTACIRKHGQLVPAERLIRKHIHETIVQVFHVFLILHHSFEISGVLLIPQYISERDVFSTPSRYFFSSSHYVEAHTVPVL